MASANLQLTLFKIGYEFVLKTRFSGGKKSLTNFVYNITKLDCRREAESHPGESRHLSAVVQHCQRPPPARDHLGPCPIALYPLCPPPTLLSPGGVSGAWKPPQCIGNHRFLTPRPFFSM